MNLFEFLSFRPKEKNLKLSDPIIVETTSRVYLKQIALNVCINYLARVFSASEFQIRKDKEIIKDTLHYKLNVRPNTDSSASEFWRTFIYRLIMDNEVLVVKTDTDDLVIAEDFQRHEYALYDDIFSDVMIKDYTFKRNFEMSEVIYVTYNNTHLESFVDDLYKDYGRLFGQMMDNSMRRHQLRGFFRFKDGGNLTQETIKRQRQIISKITDMFKDNSVAYAPIPENIEVEDLTQSNAGKDEAVNDLVKLKRDLIDDVAKMLGIPVNLVHGDVADLENTMTAFYKFGLKPLNKLINDELDAKFFTEEEHLDGYHVRILGIDRKDPLEFAVQIDKLISSGTFTPNDVLDLLGQPLSNDERLDKYYITKNYSEQTLKGGEDE